MNNACKAILFEGMFLVGNGFSKEAGKVVEHRETGRQPQINCIHPNSNSLFLLCINIGRTGEKLNRKLEPTLV